MFPCNYGTLFLAKLTISDCSGRCLLSIALKPSKACHHMGMDRETEEGERVYTCAVKINLKKKKVRGPNKEKKRKGLSESIWVLTLDGQSALSWRHQASELVRAIWALCLQLKQGGLSNNTFSFLSKPQLQPTWSEKTRDKGLTARMTVITGIYCSQMSDNLCIVSVTFMCYCFYLSHLLFILFSLSKMGKGKGVDGRKGKAG